jgi:uncharacterized protein
MGKLRELLRALAHDPKLAPVVAQLRAPAQRPLLVGIASCLLLALVAILVLRFSKRASRAGEPEAPRGPLATAILVNTAVTVLVVVASVALPDGWVAGGIALLFLGTAALYVWRKNDDVVTAHGLTLSGLVTGHTPLWSAVKRAAQALGWALGIAVILFVPFTIGFPLYWKLPLHFSFAGLDKSLWSFALGQVFVVALPEEVFYRGYLQSTLDKAFTSRVRIFGAELSPAVLITSACFALGHFATIPDIGRLAVFFPSLVFGWLRARTKDVTAGIFFHALCNIYAEALARGFGLYHPGP